VLCYGVNYVDYIVDGLVMVVSCEFSGKLFVSVLLFVIVIDVVLGVYVYVYMGKN